MSVHFQLFTVDAIKGSIKCSHCHREIFAAHYRCSVCMSVACDTCFGSLRTCPGCKDQISHSTSTGPGPNPIPFPNVGRSSDTTSGTKKVKIK